MNSNEERQGNRRQGNEGRETESRKNKGNSSKDGSSKRHNLYLLGLRYRPPDVHSGADLSDHTPHIIQAVVKVKKGRSSNGKKTPAKGNIRKSSKRQGVHHYRRDIDDI